MANNDFYTDLTVSDGSRIILEATPAADNAAPTISFGDGDSGFYERFDDDIRVSIAGTGTWEFAANSLGGVNAGNAILNSETATTTNPTVLPYRNDTDTGMGADGSNALTLITGGTAALTLNSSQNATFAGNVDVNGTEILIGGADSRLAENQLRFNSAGAAYIDHGTTSQSIKFRLSNSSALDVTPLEITPSYLAVTGNIVAGADSTYNLGSSGVRWANAYIDGLSVLLTATIGGNLLLQSTLQVLNKAQTSYINLAARDTSGSEVVYNLSNVGTITCGSVTSTGGQITGTLTFTDGSELRLGASNDMGLFYSSGTSNIRVN